MLVRLLFASRAAEPAAATIASICQHSQPRNAERGITGVLVCGDGVFMQAIEGGRAAINSLYGEIQRDARRQSSRREEVLRGGSLAEGKRRGAFELNLKARAA